MDFRVDQVCFYLSSADYALQIFYPTSKVVKFESRNRLVGFEALGAPIKVWDEEYCLICFQFQYFCCLLFSVGYSSFIAQLRLAGLW